LSPLFNEAWLLDIESVTFRRGATTNISVAGGHLRGFARS
jgi:hypothetical protein